MLEQNNTASSAETKGEGFHPEVDQLDQLKTGMRVFVINRSGAEINTGVVVGSEVKKYVTMDEPLAGYDGKSVYIPALRAWLIMHKCALGVEAVADTERSDA